MKNKYLIKILSLLLSFIFVFSCGICAFASSDNDKQYPVVFVDGMDSKPIFKFNSDGTKSAVFPPDKSVISKVGNSLTEQLTTLKIFGKNTKDTIGNLLIIALNSAFEDFGCDQDGNINPQTGIDWDCTVTHYDEELKAYHFAYDWRISTFNIAQQLNDYINLVKSQTGKEKVYVRAFSMGGPVLMTYISQYGLENIAGMMLDSTAVLGSNIAGDMLNGNIEFDSFSLVRYLYNMLDSSEVSELINSIVQVLYKTDVLDGAVDAVSAVVEMYKDRLYSEFITESFASLPGVWSLVPNAVYSTAKDELLDSEKNSKLIEVNDRYQNNVQLKAESFLDEAVKNGIKLGIVSKYNVPLAPCVESFNHQSDNTIDTVFTSLGAFCSELGKTLPDDYVQASFKNVNYISPDRIIDASTCLYPDRTWFVRDMAHDTKRNTYLVELADFVFSGDGQVTVNSDSRFPQFSCYNKENGSVSKLEADNDSDFVIVSIFELLIRIIKLIANMIFG